MIKVLKTFFDQALGIDKEPQQAELAINLCSIALMTLVAQIDQEFDSVEQTKIIELGKSLFNINEASAEELLNDAIQANDLSTSLYEYTSEINQHFNEQQKYDLVKALWLVAYADKQIDRYEEHIIRRISDLIYLDHVRFIQAKVEASAG